MVRAQAVQRPQEGPVVQFTDPHALRVRRRLQIT